ncbi:MAG TPA: ABC transporter ATP-binding protein [Acidimicrobiales bacterium]|nr:ABC transporter ATP-binding protein [Acidimicrobiales bacterium]
MATRDQEVDDRTDGAPATVPATVGASLVVSGLDAGYGDAISVLDGVDLEVPAGKVVALLGANGAGKTTLLRAVTGLLRIHRGRITAGSVHLDGKDITDGPPAAIVRAGLAQVMEGRRIFAELTVEENLRTGAITRRDTKGITTTFDEILELFPPLADRRSDTAGYLSGGEQQMVAIGRALMAKPRLLVLDEPSLGLAPLIVEQIGRIVADINAGGTSVLLVEQNAMMALGIADFAYVVETGHIVRSGPAQELREDTEIQEFYLGVSSEGRTSFREVGAYPTAKSWRL